MAEEYRTLEEWRRVYKEKERFLLEQGYEEVSPYEFYRELFPVGSLQGKGESGTGKGNIVANSILKTRRKVTIISDGLEDLPKVVGQRFGLIGPYSCYGKSYKQEYIHELFAVVIDIDYVTKVNLKRLLRMFQNWEEGKENTYKRLPPTYLASSGRGVHLYYFLDKPIEMYKHRAETLTKLKRDLVNALWNDFTSLKGDEPDAASISQGFRCVGSLSKICLDKDRKKVVTKAYPVKAYRISGKRYNLYEIKESIPGCEVDIDSLYRLPEVPKGKMTKAEAKELYPEWYERRVERGEPPKPHKKTWTCNTALYEWWKGKITEEAKVGGRYYAIVALCCYGRKCGISDGKIRKDAWQYFELLENLTDDEANHFSRSDMRDALSVLKDPDLLKTVEHTREWIEKKTKIDIPVNKRNGRTQKEHLQADIWIDKDSGKPSINVCKANRELGYRYAVSQGRVGGRAEQQVKAWRDANPSGKKADCIRETGLSKPTVYKWWK